MEITSGLLLKEILIKSTRILFFLLKVQETIYCIYRKTLLQLFPGYSFVALFGIAIPRMLVNKRKTRKYSY